MLLYERQLDGLGRFRLKKVFRKVGKVVGKVARAPVGIVRAQVKVAGKIARPVVRLHQDIATKVSRLAKTAAPIAATIPGPWQAPAVALTAIEKIKQVRRLTKQEEQMQREADAALQDYAPMLPAAARPAGVPDAPVPSMDADEARAQFEDWLADWRPDVYEAAATAMDQSLGGLNWDSGEWQSGLGGLGDWMDVITSAGSKLLKTVYEKKMLDAQLKRAKAGQPPLPQPVVEQVAAKAAPPPSSGVDMKTIAIVGGVGLGVAALFLLRPRGRRR